ncbi:Protein rhomboid [Pseudolycoriella hygida]|uniref:Protein rhomboid n=1 Tax=Pseudolycoriella hygida TaxID=35572 RepID=A0A9Q0MV31_9DIPT|nr:Protein rhomboid [Pseudolycoriella hygida]
MENKTDEDRTAQAVVSKWRTLVRQQSSKLGTLANNVVLPKNERNLRMLSKAEKIGMQNVEAQQPDTVEVVATTTVKKTEHFPVFMIVISVVQIILYYTFDEDLLCMKFGYDPHRRHEIWRFITQMFVHSGYSHLWGNVIMQLILGVFLEIVHKWKRIGIIYLAAVFGGSMCTTVLDNEYYAVGASAGVMGLLFSHLATIALNWNEMDRKFTRLFCISLYIVYDVGTDLYSALILKEENNISHSGHLGGAITGFLVSILVLKNFKKHPWEETMQKICIGILIALFLVVFVINVTAWDYFPENEWNTDYEKSYQEANEDYSEYNEYTTESTQSYYDY